jgi:integrase
MSGGTTYDARGYRTEVYKGKEVATYHVRWKVGGKLWREGFRTAAQADSFRSALSAAARKGEAFRLLRDHLANFATASDGRLFGGVRGGELPTITYRRAWIKARQMALNPAEQASPLARRLYDLRHACLSTWLNGGVYPTQVAEWAGHGVDVLLRIYAKCVVGQDELAKRRISEALRQD